MKINESKIKYLIKEYSTNVKKIKKLDSDAKQQDVKISNESKKKIVFKKTLDDLCEKLVKKSAVNKKD